MISACVYEEMCQMCNLPLTVGGGVSIEKVGLLLHFSYSLILFSSQYFCHFASDSEKLYLFPIILN
jgi:hypothetical protein